MRSPLAQQVLFLLCLAAAFVATALSQLLFDPTAPMVVQRTESTTSDAVAVALSGGQSEYLSLLYSTGKFRTFDSAGVQVGQEVEVKCPGPGWTTTGTPTAFVLRDSTGKSWFVTTACAFQITAVQSGARVSSCVCFKQGSIQPTVLAAAVDPKTNVAFILVTVANTVNGRSLYRLNLNDGTTIGSPIDLPDNTTSVAAFNNQLVVGRESSVELFNLIAGSFTVGPLQARTSAGTVQGDIKGVRFINGVVWVWTFGESLRTRIYRWMAHASTVPDLVDTVAGSTSSDSPVAAVEMDGRFYLPVCTGSVCQIKRLSSLQRKADTVTLAPTVLGSVGAVKAVDAVGTDRRFVALSASAVYHVTIPSPCRGSIDAPSSGPICSGQGMCIDGECRCDSASVNQQFCAGLACARGSCDPSDEDCYCSGASNVCNAKTGLCLCLGSSLLSQSNGCIPSPSPECGSQKTCKDCVRLESCGWCESTGVCWEGDELIGPNRSAAEESDRQGCKSWQVGECAADLSLDIFGGFLSALVAVMIVLNVVSVVREDLYVHEDATSESEFVHAWWRQQRSHKAWGFIDQLQMCAAVAFLHLRTPMRFQNFFGGPTMRWAVLGFGDGSSEEVSPPEAQSTGRSLQSFDTFESMTLSSENGLFGTAVLSVIVMLVTVLCLAAVGYTFSVALRSDGGKALFFNRAFHALVRVALFVYFPLAVLAAHALSSASWDVALGSVLVLSVFHVGFIVLNTYGLRKGLSTMFAPSRLKKFGSLYAVYSVERGWFASVVMLRKLLSAVVIGLLASAGTAQAVLLAIVSFAYVLLVLWLRPVMCSVGNATEILTHACNAVAMLLLLSGVEDGQASLSLRLIFATIATILMLVPLFAFLLGYIHNWLRMHRIREWRQVSSHCRGGNKSLVQPSKSTRRQDSRATTDLELHSLGMSPRRKTAAKHE